MTNKKLKLAAMSVALTACVAAQPMVAHAVDAPDAAEDDNAARQTAPAKDAAAEAGTAETQSEEAAEPQENFEAPVNDEAPEDKQLPAFGPGVDSSDVEIDYGEPQPDPDKDNTTITVGEVIDKNQKDETTGEPGKEIGDATKTETEDPSSTTTEVIPSTDPDDVLGKDKDGSTIVKGTETTITEGTGEAESTIKTDPEEKEISSLEDELGTNYRDKLNWGISDAVGENGKKTTIGDYHVDTVTDSADGDSKDVTLKKTNTTEGRLSAEEIKKLLDANDLETKEETDAEGKVKTTYTLKKVEPITDADGKVIGTRTTYYEVTDDKVTTITETTLKVTVAKGTETGNVDKTTEIKLPDITVKNTDETKTDVIKISSDKLDEILKDPKNNQGGNTYTYTEEIKNADGTKTTRDYTITVDDSKTEGLGNKDIADLLGDGFTGDDNGVYYKGEKLMMEQLTAVRRTLSYHVTVEETTRKPDQVAEGGGLSGSVAEAEAKAKLEALRNALIAVADKAGITLTEEELNRVTLDGDHLTVSRTDNTSDTTYNYTFNYKGEDITTVSNSTKTGETTVNGKDAENVEETVVSGTAYVTGGSKTWEGSGSFSNTVEGELAEGISSDFTIPDGITHTKEETLNGVRTVVYEYNGKTYTLTYTTPDENQLARIKADLEKKLRDDGKTSDEISAILSNEQFQWVSWTVTHTEIESKTETDTKEVDLSETNWSISDRNATSGVRITVNGVTYDNLSTTDGGKTYTGKKGNQHYTITIGKTETLTDANDIEKLIRSRLETKYGDGFTFSADNIDVAKGTATYWDADGHEHTIKYVNAETTSITVSIREETEHGSVSGSATTEAEAEKKLMEAIESARKEANDAGYDLVIGDTVIKPGTTFEEIKHVLESVNYGTLTGQDLIDYLNQAKQDANAGNTEKEKDAYTGTGYWDEWGGNKNLYNKNTIGHLDLGTSSKLTTIDGEEVDCVLVKKNLYWNESAEDLVGEGKNNHEVGLINRITFDNEEGRGNGHYEYPRASWDDYGSYWNSDTKTWETKHIDNYPTTSQFYKVTGTIAYGLYEDKNNWTGSKYYDRTTADRKLKELKEKYPDAQIVQIYNGQDKNSSSYYQIYLYQSEMTSYGYLSKSNSNCANKTFGYNDGFYDYDWWSPVKPGSSNIGYIGGYDLILSNLTQISKEKVTGQQTFDYKANLSYRARQGEDINSSNNALRATSDSCKYDVPHTVTDAEGNGYNGTYDVTFTQSYEWKKGTDSEAKGTGKGRFKSFTELLKKLFSGSGSTTRDEAKGSYSYKTTDKDKLEISAVSKVEQTTTVAHVDYNYTTVSEKETTVVIPPVTPPEDPEPPIKDETPVTPDTPELPPVQDATPDEVISPASPELPPVQDAAALPQTGVNGLAALGMALSGLTLMIMGAFTSLKYKEKH